jgi:guanosine-3',5'-bis(diphosphate) 3'-pyrophosphohydrolase
MQRSWSQDEYVRAYRFAAEAHLGQTVPGSELPYVAHVTLVSMEVIAALEVESGRDGNLAVQCALLHDVIEDTAVTYEGLHTAFGERIAQGVLALSKDESLDRSLQIRDSLARIQRQPPEIWMVKLADRIANLQPPPHYWTKTKIAQYRQEAIEIYDALYPASDALATRLLAKIERYKVHL